ncbi:hypothetical protein D3C86_2000030 [compost metagenome]
MHEVVHLPGFPARLAVDAGIVGEVGEGIEILFQELAHQAADRVELLGADAMGSAGIEGVRGRRRRVRLGKADA